MANVRQSLRDLQRNNPAKRGHLDLTPAEKAFNEAQREKQKKYTHYDPYADVRDHYNTNMSLVQAETLIELARIDYSVVFPCVHCHEELAEHADRKCLFEPVEFKGDSEWRNTLKFVQSFRDARNTILKAMGVLANANYRTHVEKGRKILARMAKVCPHPSRHDIGHEEKVCATCGGRDIRSQVKIEGLYG